MRQAGHCLEGGVNSGVEVAWAEGARQVWTGRGRRSNSGNSRLGRDLEPSREQGQEEVDMVPMQTQTCCGRLVPWWDAPIEEI